MSALLSELAPHAIVALIHYAMAAGFLWFVCGWRPAQ